MIFSRRHCEALASGSLRPELDPMVRKELHAFVRHCDGDIAVLRGPSSILTDQSSSILFEIVTDVKAQYGWLCIPGLSAEARLSEELRALMETLEAYRVLDLLEELGTWLQRRANVSYNRQINEIFKRHGVSWSYTGSTFVYEAFCIARFASSD